jgi:hypothetical protein
LQHARPFVFAPSANVAKLTLFDTEENSTPGVSGTGCEPVAAHESSRTTELYASPWDDESLDEVERIAI